jgi:hypothetical protein
MYIIEKKEKIKIKDIDNVEPFVLFGKELDYINKGLGIFIIVAFVVLLLVWGFMKDDSVSIPMSPTVINSGLPRSSLASNVTRASRSSRKSKN